MHTASSGNRIWDALGRLRSRPLLLLAGLVLAACQRAQAPFPRAPIILISLDTVRWDSGSGFGADGQATPELLAFCQDAIRFENAIATSHHTAPSHASILTGCSPFVHGVALGSANHVYAIPAALPTLAELLRDAGYATGGFTDGVQLIPERGFNRGFDIWADRLSGLPDKLADIEAFVREHADEPFFLFAHTYRAHLPYRVPADLLGTVLDGYDGPFRRPIAQASRLPHDQFISRSPEQATRKARLSMQMAAARAKKPEDLQVLRQAYDAGVTGADRELGALLDVLRRTGTFDRAIILVLSDHGEAFNEHGTAGHRDLFDENLRVPLALRLPAGRQAGRRVEQVFSSIHLLPTLLDLVGVKPTREAEGTSVAAALLAGRPIREIPAFSALYMTGRDDPVVASVRTRSFKRLDALVEPEVLGPNFRAVAPYALFDLRNDPAEQVNRAGEELPAFGQLGGALRQARQRWQELRRLYGLEAAATVEIAEEAERDLRGLGYLGGE